MILTSYLQVSFIKSMEQCSSGCYRESCVTGERKQVGRNGRQIQPVHVIRQSREMSPGLQKASVEGSAIQKRGPLPGGSGPGKRTKTTLSSTTLSGWLLAHTCL